MIELRLFFGVTVGELTAVGAAVGPAEIPSPWNTYF
jgi:hypothetical protein